MKSVRLLQQMGCSVEKYLYEFANIGSRRTGIKKVHVHVYSQGDKELAHSPRIKVSNVYGKFRTDDCFTVSIVTKKVMEGKVKIKVEEFAEVLNWIDLNKELLIEYWKVGNDMDTDEFLDSLRSI